MFKNIVSSLFDTINDTITDTITDTIKDTDTIKANVVEPIIVTEAKKPDYCVAVPNKTIPINFSSIKPSLLCVYQVRTDGLYPFILFLLERHGEQLSFIAPGGSSSNKKIKYSANVYLNTLFPTLSFTYAGFYETIANNIIIFNCLEPTTPTNLETVDYIWATSFEIMNKKLPIHKSVTDFFLFNTDFLLLKTLNRRIYESPMIGYAPVLSSQSFEELDIFRETKIPALGKCYYLFSGIPSAKKMIRVAFFAGTMLFYPVKKEQKYDSLLCHSHSQGDNYYIIQNYNQHVVLSI
jgi:hypothetical protein